jgi:hypothetical protein
MVHKELVSRARQCATGARVPSEYFRDSRRLWSWRRRGDGRTVEEKCYLWFIHLFLLTTA